MIKKTLFVVIASLYVAAFADTRVQVYEVPHSMVDENEDNIGRLYSNLKNTPPIESYRTKGDNGHYMSKDGVTISMSNKRDVERNFDAIMDLAAKYALHLKSKNKKSISKMITSLKDYK